VITPTLSVSEQVSAERDYGHRFGWLQSRSFATVPMGKGPINRAFAEIEAAAKAVGIAGGLSAGDRPGKVEGQ
jgi:hypothetical protein